MFNSWHACPTFSSSLQILQELVSRWTSPGHPEGIEGAFAEKCLGGCPESCDLNLHQLRTWFTCVFHILFHFQVLFLISNFWVVQVSWIMILPILNTQKKPCGMLVTARFWWRPIDGVFISVRPRHCPAASDREVRFRRAGPAGPQRGQHGTSAGGSGGEGTWEIHGNSNMLFVLLVLILFLGSGWWFRTWSQLIRYRRHRRILILQATCCCRPWMCCESFRGPGWRIADVFADSAILHMLSIDFILMGVWNPAPFGVYFQHPLIMLVRQCHKPPMTRNGFYTPSKKWWWLGDGASMALFYQHSSHKINGVS